MGEISLSDDEVRRILENAAKKKVSTDGDQTPIVSIDIIKENIKKGGKVWEKDKDSKKVKKTKNPS